MQILRSLFLGIIAALLALILEIIFSFTPGFSFKILFQQASWILVAVVLIEELFKLAFIWKNFSLNANVSSKLQIFFQSLFIGLGFAITEATLKFFTLLPEEASNPNFYLPILCTIVIHIGISGLMGYFLVGAKKLNFWTFFQILLVSFGWHFLFNFFVIYSVSPWLISIFLVLLGFFVVLAGLRINASQKTYAQ